MALTTRLARSAPEPTVQRALQPVQAAAAQIAPLALLRSPVHAARSPCRGPAPAPAPSPARQLGGLMPLCLQPALQVSQAHDPAEREAEQTARAVMQMNPAAPAGPAATGSASPAPVQVQRSAAGPMAAAGGLAGVMDVQADIRSSLGGGTPLSPALRRFMEPRFRASFGGVRLHTDSKAAGLAARVAARAFTFGQHIFFGRGQYQPDTPAGRELIAHELTHTLQQRAEVQKQAAPPVQRQALAGAAAAPAITHRRGPQVQRLGLDTVLDYIADKANIIPGFRLFTIVIGVNPINGAKVDPTPGNFLRAAIEFIPGGGLVTQALDNSGIFDKVANWAVDQIGAAASAARGVIGALKAFISDLGVTDFARPGATWERAKRLFTGPIDQIKSTIKGFVTGIVAFVKDAILKPIAQLAEGTPSYDLLKGVMGKDPITGEPATDSAELLIGGFMRLINQGDVWENMKKSGAVGKAWAWFKGAMGDLKAFVLQIPPTFVAAFKSLVLADIILVPRAFAKLVGVFGSFLARFVSWAGNAVWNLLEIIFSVVKPGAWGYVQRTGAALKSILKNPLPFVGNLARAAKAGFQNFAGRFGTHLQKGLIDWLTGSLTGVYIPRALSLGEIVKFAFSVLGLTWVNLRAKLVKAVGEPAVGAMEKGFAIVKTLVTQGPAAAWEQIKDELLAQKDKVVEGIRNLVIEAVVTKAVPKLVAMFIPGAGFITAIVSIYDLVMVFVQKLATIARVVAAFVDSIVAIAAGNIGAAAAKVESVLAGLLSLAINFLAGFAGLGKIANKINGIVQKIRAPVDKALDSLALWVKKVAGKFLAGLKAAAKKLLNWWRKKAPFSGGGQSHTVLFEGQDSNARLVVRSKPKTPADFVRDFVVSGASSAEAQKINGLSTAIDGTRKLLVTAAKKDPPDEALLTTLDKTLTQQMNALGAALADLLNKSTDEEGSEKKPVPADYPKRRAAAYPNIYVGPLSNRYIAQDWLKAAAAKGGGQASKDTLAALAKAGGEPLDKEPGFMSWGGKVTVAKAAGGPGQSLPNNSTVGLDPAFASLAPGKVLVYDLKAGTGGGSKINNLFRPFGFRPGKEGMDGDHVMERQLGGPDAVHNLWPLPRGENRSSGATINTMKVTFKGAGMSVHQARDKRKKKDGLHLLIKSTTGG